MHEAHECTCALTPTNPGQASGMQLTRNVATPNTRYTQWTTHCGGHQAWDFSPIKSTMHNCISPPAKAVLPSAGWLWPRRYRAKHHRMQAKFGASYDAVSQFMPGVVASERRGSYSLVSW